MLTFEQLHILRKVARARTFTRAADELALTQPAISQRIRRLEQALGTEIFDRSAKGREVRLTPAGERVLRFAEEVLGRLEQLQRDLERERAARRHAMVTIACDTSGVKAVLPALLAAYHVRCPDVRVNLMHRPREEINTAVAAGEADLGLQLSPWVTARFRSVPILRDRMVLLAPPGHPVLTEPERRQARVRSAAFVLSAPGSLSREVAEAWAAAQGIELDVVLESRSMDAVKEAAAHGFGLTILPELWVVNDLREGRLCIVPIEGLPQEFEVCLIADAGRTLSPPVRALLEVAQEGRWRERLPAWPPAPALSNEY